MKQEKTLIHDFTEGAILSQLFRFGAPFILSSYAPVAALPYGITKGASAGLLTLLYKYTGISKGCSVIHHKNLSIDCLGLIAGKEQNGIGLIY